jgi:Tfp pilus assembly protein PilN
MPGWGIVVDLTPPELIASRRLKVIRKLIALAAVLLLLVCLALYSFAWMQRQSASQALAREQQRTATLQSEQHKYNDVTEMQSSLSQVQGQLRTLLAGDVSFPSLISELRSSLQPGMTIDNLSVTVNLPGASAAGAGSSAAGNSLDTSGHPHIGTITLSGASTTASYIAAFADKLSSLKGLVDVITPSLKAQANGIQYTLTASFTDELLSHEYDSTKNGGK